MGSKREAFDCNKCGKKTNAPLNTDRIEKKLCTDCFGKRKDKRENKLNNFTGSEWAKNSKSIEQYPDTRSEKQRIHGASFPRSLAKQQIEIYTKQGDTVLDPFLGVGTTMDACMELERKGIGIELNQEFADLAMQDINQSINGIDIKVLIGDSKQRLKEFEDNSIDFVMTSPPYANLLKNVKGDFGYKWREHSEIDPIKNAKPYSEDLLDVGNMSYDEAMLTLKDILKETYRVQKPNTYAVWVVKDFRDLKSKVPYVNFHGDVISVAEESGYTLWDIRIYDQTQFRPLVVLGYPSRNYYLNIGHSYILVLKKM